MKKRTLVIKVGTALITDNEGNINTKLIENLVQGIAIVYEDYNVILVSSGAVGCGRNRIAHFDGKLLSRKAASAIGNPILIKTYANFFEKYDLNVAQVLCERIHFSDRQKFLELKRSFELFWNNNIIPIVNENDLFSSEEIKFSDNDQLATILAVGFDSELLMLCTSAGGFKDENNHIVPIISTIDNSVFDCIKIEKTSLGLGGMRSKLGYTKLATDLGIPVVICGVEDNQAVSQALAHQIGTYFRAKNIHLNDKKRWLASSSLSIGSVTIDAGAAKALQQQKSLLNVGILKVDGSFLKGEIIKIYDPEEELLGIAKSKCDALDIMQIIGDHNFVVAHVDDIVIF